MSILHNFSICFTQPPILFFLLGLVAALLKSDLEMPEPIGKFLALYLFLAIGFKGGQELLLHGVSASTFYLLLCCILMSSMTPFICYGILKHKANHYDAGAIAASYGSCGTVTFLTAVAFLEANEIAYNPIMLSAIVLMEIPAIISGLLVIRMKSTQDQDVTSPLSIGHTFLSLFKNWTIFLLLGSVLIGLISGERGGEALRPFVSDIFKGMLCLYMLDIGVLAGKKIESLQQSGLFLSSFALLYPLTAASILIFSFKFTGVGAGTALLLTTLGASASYTGVPAAMRFAVPEANMSLVIPMALGLTLTFNVIVGIPLYNVFIQTLWA